jgi:cyanophycinase
MRKNKIVTFLLLGIVLISCQKEKNDGKLFIIGGGRVNTSMIDKMIEESGIDKGGYMVILPMSSAEPLESIKYTDSSFKERQDIEIYGFNIIKGEPVADSRIDSIRNAKLIFISGGDQSRFLDVIEGTPVKQAIHDAFKSGSLIAGTSAGASVMSKIMVTGNELKYPDDSGNFESIESGNIETIEGLGLLESVIIDQHFIVRKRMNRMISYSVENPNHLCVGIDESTAIYVEGQNATVYGKRQVVVLRNSSAKTKIENGLLGSRNMQLNVFLPGESFKLNQ